MSSVYRIRRSHRHRRFSMHPFATFASLVMVVGLTATGLRSFDPGPNASAKAAQAPPARGQGLWAEKAWLGENRTEAGVVFVAGKLYVVGGMARGMDSQTVNQEYDP